ncbi:MAG TPA: methionine--tRNA ligase [Nitriliruptorales bacterium]|nr:methionine--tRNA ligase [Nitriliruptorales bacterium]
MSSRSGGKHVLVAVAWPYANGSLHLGHMAGAYLPADIFARYHRVAGDRVLMVSGSDAHGTPITVRADQEGVTARAIVERFHPEFLRYWKEFGISFDLFTTTMTDNHREVVHDLFNTLRERGYIDTRTTEQFYDPQAERFLPDRYVEGTCPHCGYEQARGDQCENCGRTLDPADLLTPRSKLSGAPPVVRATEHYFVLLSKLQQQVHDWLRTREGWRPHVINWALGFVREGLHDRAITRDLDWGVPLPPGADTIGDGKRIYVWFEAVIGYLSASKEWARRQGEPDAWKAWWQDPDAETYYFIGKDNIPFHAVFWPAYLLGYGGLNLPTDVPANQYVTFRGAKASKSAGVGRSVLEYLSDHQPDALRYALAANLPEQQDTDLTDEEVARRINDELVATWGNLVHRVVTMTARDCDARVPQPGRLDDDDTALLRSAEEALVEEAGLLHRVELRAALRVAMRAAQDTNAYLNRKEPWKTAQHDPARTATTLYVALNAINAAKVGLYPFLPFSSTIIHRDVFGFTDPIEADGWRRVPLAPGTPARPSGPLFRKVEEAAATVPTTGLDAATHRS